MANQLALTNVINISVAAVGTGVNAYNTSNLALITGDTPNGGFPVAGYQLYLDPTGVATDFGTTSNTYKMADAIFSQQPNILAGGGALIVIALTASETMDACITRTKAQVEYFGVMSTTIESQADMLAAAAVVQALNKIAFFVCRVTGAIDPGGQLDMLRSGSFSQSRGLWYGSATDIDALVYQASYAGRALSVNFSGSNTTQTMNLKTLIGVLPDPTITQTLLSKALAAGVDTYPSLQGVPAVLCSGLNQFFDRVYNLQWIVGALQVAGFNYLAQTATKLPQTEAGMTGLKGAYRAVLVQAAVNQYVAPGNWTSSTTFGNQLDMLSNIQQNGYYIYSLPVSQQLTVDRVARKAPLVQIAIQEAGALQSSSVVVNVNA